MENTMKERHLDVLKLEHVSKNFGGVVAADDICIEINPGEIFGLIGPNGAGKTTILNIIMWIYDADKGNIYLGGTDITKLPTYKRARMGIARTFQHPRLLTRCDILTNIQMGIDLTKRTQKQNVDESELRELLEAANLQDVDLSLSVGQLSYGQQKLLEIVRAVLSHPYIMLVDEPAAGLNHREMDYIVALFNIAVKKGIAVLLIEHAMDLVMGICDRITVLNFGKQIMTGTPDEVQNNDEVIAAYLGGSANAED